MSAVKDLRFHELRDVNEQRCATAFNHPLGAWSLAEWSNAMAGEAGEACNVTKKVLRMETADKVLDTPAYRKKLKQALADEIADTIIYADLLAAAAGIDLAKAVRNKFNKVSRKRGYGRML